MKNSNRKLFPKIGQPKEELLRQMEVDKQNDLKWKEGKSFCLVYYPGEEKADMVQKAYNLFFTENALNPMSFPSLRRYETEVVSMVADLLHGDDEVVGSLTSGGTESILLAVKTARDFYRKEKPEINNPEIILPITAHPAFEKACHYFDVVPVFIPVDKNYHADLHALKTAITENTIMIVGSAPSYPQGVIDPIGQIAKMALERNILCHVDACVGGFFLPFMKKLNYPIPVFDFEVPGVTSMSADIHKFGYAAKGASVVLYKNTTLRKFQFFVSTGWPGGIYGSATIAGTRPGGSIAAAYAAIVGIGENGYLELTEKTMEITEKLRKGIELIPELKIMGKPDASILAFDSEMIDVYELADELNILGWHFERLQNPAGLHLTIHQIHELSADAFLHDLKVSVNKVKKFKVKHIGRNIKIAAVKRLIKILPEGTLARIQAQFSGKAVKSVRTAPMYGMMGALTGSEDLNQIVLDLLDKLNKPD
jgi:glutamate/tyrosine decarboxylase-like PLP-dependent enzyme